MAFRTLVAGSLIFLAAAAAPPPDCAPNPMDQPLTPSALEQVGSAPEPGLTDKAYATLPTSGTPGCGGGLPAMNSSASLQNQTGDVLHGLPAAESLRPVDKPRQTPQFR